MYLIDGNNVMGQRVGWHKDKSGARRQLLHELAQFAQLKKIRLAVVFDGAPEINIADGSSQRGVKVYYARENSDADARIIEFAEQTKNRQSLTVITSDLQLTQRVRACGIRVIKSGQFRQMMATALDETQAENFAVEENELSGWMRYFGVDEDE